MNTRTKFLIAIFAAACGIAGVVRATPIVGLFFASILATGTSNSEARVHVRVALPIVVGGPADQEDEWTAKFSTSGPSTFIVQDVSYLPGGHTGWHSHPGVLLVTVTEGTLEWFNDKCEGHIYKAGDNLTEGTALHYWRNLGSVNARVMVTYVLAKGQPRRIDQPAPACAAALGLF
jgi:quercetin dioxygenase-like cupin family protein